MSRFHWHISHPQNSPEKKQGKAFNNILVSPDSIFSSSTNHKNQDVSGRLFLCLKSSNHKGLTIRKAPRGIVTAQIFNIILSITARGSTTLVILKGVNMARTVQPLTNTQVKQAKPKDKVYDLSDGGGLQLRIKPNGSKLWNFFYPRPTTQEAQHY